MPRGFAFPDTETLAWIPRVVPATASFGGFSDQSVARLRADAAPADAQADLNAVIPKLADRFPGSSAQSVIDDAKLAALVRPLKTTGRRPGRSHEGGMSRDRRLQLYALLLRLYPKASRHEYEAGMIEMFELRTAEAAQHKNAPGAPLNFYGTRISFP